ncbi:MAG: metalloregulator ArsR/SmtB family transcription factor [Gammaproteobacteria bacterium]|nr:metalloregulator ArsR/SmtB family transcription factor [Gammaproteobacteria bacterium]
MDKSTNNAHLPTQALDDGVDLCRSLKILANPNRLRILLHLLEGEASVGEIESILKIKQPSLSHELKKLRDAEFVSTRRLSKAIFYRLKSDAIKTMLVSIPRALNASKIAGDQQPLSIDNRTRDDRTLECGLFAKIL